MSHEQETWVTQTEHTSQIHQTFYIQELKQNQIHYRVQAGPEINVEVTYTCHHDRWLIKDDVHSVLRISSAHNKGGPPDINIAQILHLSNFFELKRTVYIHLQA
jgi:hypothetical protein